MQLTPYAFPVAASAVLLAVLTFVAWNHRPAQGATSFCLLLLAITEWSLGYTLELTGHTLSLALFWDNMAWVGMIAAPTLWLIFVLSYTGRANWLTRQNLAFLLIEPFVTLLLVWTNRFHGLVEHVRLDTNSSFSILIVTYNVWGWLNVVYSYALLFLGAFILCSFILTVAHATYLDCVQGLCLLVAVLVPWVGSVLQVRGVRLLSDPNLMPYAFFVSSLAFSLGLFLFRLLDIRPLTREIVIESMKEAAMVLDTQDRVVDLNLAARQLIACKTSKVIGRPFAEIFSTWPELVECCRNREEVDEEVIFSECEEPHYLGLRITPLYRRNGRSNIAGRLVALYDITERIQAGKALKESEGRFRNIFAEVPIGMAIVDLRDRVLEVNKAFCEMLEYSEQELMGVNLATITHPDDIGADMVLVGKALSGEINSYKVEKRYLKKNHETLWTDLTATILRDQKGEAVGGLVMLENIIERKRAKLLEEERYHVAYELHDGLAQVLVSVHQHLQALASHYHPRSSQARQELDKALELAQHAVREARRLIAGLRPTVLDDFGLAMALRLQVETQRKDGWTIHFNEALGPERLPRTLETTLFGVAQEALTNIRKHSHTTRACLTLQRQDSTIRLEVQDWGIGFEPRTLFKVYRPGEHVGIRAMQERVELLGGHLFVSSNPGFGTQVIAEVPILPSNGKDHSDAADVAELEAAPLLLRGHLTERSEYDASNAAELEAAPLLLRNQLTERNEYDEH